MPLVGHQHQIDILELTDKGDGKGRLFDRPLFVEGLLPGEQALVELTEVKPNYLHGKLVELGPTAQVLRAPEHPYTRSLIAAVPRLTGGTRFGKQMEATA